MMLTIERNHLFTEKVIKSNYPLLTPSRPKLLVTACSKLLVYNNQLTHTSTEQEVCYCSFSICGCCLNTNTSWLEGEDSGFLKQHLILGYIVTVSGA